MKFQALFIISIALCIGLIQAKALSKSEPEDMEGKEITKDQAKRWYGYDLGSGKGHGSYGFVYPSYVWYGKRSIEELKRNTEEDKAIAKHQSRNIFDVGMLAVNAFSGFGKRNTKKLVDSKDVEGQEIIKDQAKRWYGYGLGSGLGYGLGNGIGYGSYDKRNTEEQVESRNKRDVNGQEITKHQARSFLGACMLAANVFNQGAIRKRNAEEQVELRKKIDKECQEIAKDQAKRYGYGSDYNSYDYYFGKRNTEEDKAIAKHQSRNIFDVGMLAVNAFSGFGKRNTKKLGDSKDVEGQEIIKNQAKRYYRMKIPSYYHSFRKRNIQ